MEIFETRPLTKKDDTLSFSSTIKELDFGRPLLNQVKVADIIDNLVLHSIHPDKIGHERRSDSYPLDSDVAPRSK